MRERIGCVLLAAGLAGCAPAFGTLATPVPDEPRLGRAEARSIVDWGLHYECRRRIQCTVQMGNSSATVRTTLPDRVQVARITFDRPIVQAKGDLIGYVIWLPAVVDGQRTAWNMTIMDKADAQRFVDAFGDMVRWNAGSTNAELEFRARAAEWRAANPKPALSAEGQRHKVLAENAFRERDVAVAIQHYEAALDTDPAWPNGNFNLALLLAETGEYGPAARHMRRYLALVPDGKDARAANDKVIIWEEKARQ